MNNYNFGEKASILFGIVILVVIFGGLGYLGASLNKAQLELDKIKIAHKGR